MSRKKGEIQPEKACHTQEGDYNGKILEEMLACNTTCADIGTFKPKKEKEGIEKIDFLLDVLPGATYVLDQLVHYLFSSSLVTGLVDEDEKLNGFLFSKNKRGETNYSQLRGVVRIAAAYGECGLRWLNGSLYTVKPGTYAPLVMWEDGIEHVVAWILTKKGEYITEEKYKIPEDVTIYTIEERLREQDLIILDTNDFLNIKREGSGLHGESTLLKDSLRIDLLVTAYQRLNYDLEYDGPGRLILQPKDGYVASDSNEISTTEVAKQTASAQKLRNERAKQEIERIGKEVKESGSDSVILLSNAFDKDITKLPRVTKSTEFFDWLQREGVILAQAFGLPPSLLELGDVSGNVSMEKIIDNAMLNTIIPLRESYATQFSSFLAEHIGVRKIYFDKYELQQSEDENTMRTKIVNIMSLLNSMDGNEKAKKLCDDFADMLSTDIHNDKGDLRTLSVGMKKIEGENNNEKT